MIPPMNTRENIPTNGSRMTDFFNSTITTAKMFVIIGLVAAAVWATATVYYSAEHRVEIAAMELTRLQQDIAAMKNTLARIENQVTGHVLKDKPEG